LRQEIRQVIFTNANKLKEIQQSIASCTMGTTQCRNLFGNSTGSALGPQTAVCGVLDPQHIPEYASDLRSCIHRFAKPMNPHRTFQTGSKALRKKNRKISLAFLNRPAIILYACGQ
jgi:hypothetical protein